VVSGWEFGKTEPWDILLALAEIGMIPEFLVLNNWIHLIAVFETK
jgi:hypothetical protein